MKHYYLLFISRKCNRSWLLHAAQCSCFCYAVYTYHCATIIITIRTVAPLHRQHQMTNQQIWLLEISPFHPITEPYLHVSGYVNKPALTAISSLWRWTCPGRIPWHVRTYPSEVTDDITDSASHYKAIHSLYPIQVSHNWHVVALVGGINTNHNNNNNNTALAYRSGRLMVKSCSFSGHMIWFFFWVCVFFNNWGGILQIQEKNNYIC